VSAIGREPNETLLPAGRANKTPRCGANRGKTLPSPIVWYDKPQAGG
jgi:hypothetical protein